MSKRPVAESTIARVMRELASRGGKAAAISLGAEARKERARKAGIASAKKRADARFTNNVK